MKIEEQARNDKGDARMYKDVWKRILAFMMAVCLIVTLVEWPDNVQAAEAKYYTYQNGSEGASDLLNADTAGAIFTANQDGQGDEVIHEIELDVHLNEGAGKATASIVLYTNPEAGNPESGTWEWSTSVELHEGTNVIEAQKDTHLPQGTSFAVIVTALQGGSLGAYAGSGQSYIKQNGQWVAAGNGAALKVITRNDVIAESEEGETAGSSFSAWLASYTAELAQTDDAGISAYSSGDTELDKKNMTIAVDWYARITLNDPASSAVSWSIDDTSIATLKENGSNSAQVTGVSVGETTIRAKDGSGEYTCTLKVTPSFKDAQVVMEPESNIYNGEQQLPEFEVKAGDTILERNVAYQVNCYQADENGELTLVPTYDESTVVDAGTYKFIVTAQPDGGYDSANSGSQVLTYTIAPKDMNDVTIEAEFDETAWITSPSVDCITKITDTARGVELAPYDETTGTGEYSLELVTDENGNTTGINICGKGNYTGTKFYGTPQTLENAAISLVKDTYVYTGAECRPTVVVAVNGLVLSEGDYDVHYEGDNINATGTSKQVGDAPSVYVTGKGMYCGTSAPISFTILPKDLSNQDQEEVSTTVGVRVSQAGGNQDAEPVIEATYNGMTLTAADDYDITENLSTEEGKGRRVLTGKGNYTGSYTVEYTIGKDIAELVASIRVDGTVTYTGEPIEPGVTLVPASGKDDEVSGLIKDRDYTLTFQNNVNAGTGTAKVTLQGIGEYGGSVSATFSIEALTIDQLACYIVDANGERVPLGTYEVEYSPNSEDLKPDVVLESLAGTKLAEGIDYNLEYDLPDTGTIIGTRKVTVIPLTNNIIGQRQLNYEIRSCNLETAVSSGKVKLTLDKEIFDYTGSVNKAVPTLTYVGATPDLEENTDYTVSYTNDQSTDIGDYQVIVQGTGNYTGTVTKTYRITAIDVETQLVIEVDPAQEGLITDYVTNGGVYKAMKWYDSANPDNNELKLVITDKSGNPLVKNTDYTLEYNGNTGVSDAENQASVTITGRGKYLGSTTIDYLLAGKLDGYEIKITDEPLTYTGDPITLKTENVSVTNGKILFWKEELEQDVDYVISYKDQSGNDTNVNAGTATATVEAMPYANLPTANGCYIYEDSTAKLSADFVIDQKDIGDTAEVELTQAISIPYAGSDVTLTADEIPLVYNGHELTASDFDIISYTNNDRVGDATVTIQGTGNYKLTRSIPFVITGKSLEEDVKEWTIEQAVYDSLRLYPKVTSMTTKDGALLTSGVDYDVYVPDSYENNTNAGIHTATITVQGLGEYTGSVKVLTFTIDPRDIGNAAIGTASVLNVASSYNYTSQAIEPSVSLAYLPIDVNGVRKYVVLNLTEGKDYTLSYENNTDAGENGSKAKVTITGIGNYTGTIEKEFEITPKNITDSSITIDPIEAQEYDNGKAVTPAPNITYTFGSGAGDVYTLVGGKDYTVEYQNAQNLGEATMTITGIGNFTGQTTVTYHIGTSISDPAKYQVSCPEVESGAEYIYSGTPYEPAVSVKKLDTGITLENGRDYEVIYTDNQNAGTATITVQGIDNYAGKQELTFEILPKDVAGSDVVLAIDGNTDGSLKVLYTGEPVTPEVTLTYNNEVIPCEVDYGSNHTDRGTVYVAATASGNPNYYGTKDLSNTPTAKFEIVNASIGAGGYVPADGFWMEQIEPQPLVGGAAAPQPKLYYNGVELTYGVDYYCSAYKNNDRIGSDAEVTLAGMGNYSGTVKQKFVIRGNIADAAITMPTEVFYKDYVPADYQEGDALPEVTFDDEIELVADGRTLIQATADNPDGDYTVTYTDNTWVGTAEVTIKGTGAWAGSVTKEVLIKADLSETTMIVGTQKYTGSKVEAVPVIEYYGIPLTVGTHFIIYDYDNNIEIGDNAMVYVVGNPENGFTGTNKAAFSIVAEAGTLTVSGVEDSYKYRGEPIKPQITVKYGTTTLASGDYDVLYGPNTDAGTGTIVVRGNNSYDNMVELVTFQIESQDINDLKVLDGTSATVAAREYTGQAIIPELTLSAKIGTTDYTLPETDYTLTAGADNIAVGTGKVVITGDGSNVIGSKEVTFQITPKSLAAPAAGVKDTISVELVPDQFSYDGTEKKPAVYVTYQYGTREDEVRKLVENVDYTLTYSNNIAAGTGTVRINGIGNYMNSRTAEFSIGAQGISTAAIELPSGYDYPYMGSGVEVEPEVQVTADGIPLTARKDYTVTYQNNTAVGIATVLITGMGSFSGTNSQTFNIVAHDIAAADVELAEIPNQPYTGSPIEPELTITCGAYKLQKGVDYDLVFNDQHTQLGLASVTIKGKNGFTGSRSATFTIAYNIANAEVVGLRADYPYTGSALSAENLGITEVRNGEAVLSEESYRFEFAEGSDGMSAGTQTLLLVGQGEYGGSKEIEITITPKNIADDDVVMTGFKTSIPYMENVTQDITLTWGTITLTRDTDYVVTCSPTANMGVYTMKVEGTGNYTGTLAEQTFTLEQVGIENAVIKNVSSTYTYTGKEIEPKPIVTLDGAELTAGEDYTVSYQDNLDAGIATLRIDGTNKKYCGTKEITFTILPRSIHLSLFGAIDQQVYTNRDITPDVEVTDNGQALDAATDYTLTYFNNRNVGTATVTVAGNNNYTATKKLRFDIRPYKVSTATVTGRSASTITVGWSEGGIATGYEIYRAGTDGKWKQIATTTRGTSYTDTRLTANTTYSYRVRAYVIEGGDIYYGDFSSVASGTTTR